ncbi:MAG TPA: imidazoleglycerol-phosphate dehydratase HisB [Leptospiraceae bacterium]|jgi:imidazoleglycerol-phosphate dehydratase|nr:imidazoleglycerol-phosphate dehydratase HisB [Leptospirales bacterium]HMU84173.1 imidazoleglycerol-phosphate dehydratase HisB [Leptospiraceae bacterium]HMW60082.1 imidazoleglycerol-phosphate dehydratase HisB [Leptospiraceae bacterium]HMY46344.1 imidazoleglycerol-phosphate dehydratase HisB [Leptospiraceae bacterium]HMZ37045.1 imidazoleglycerol-phosphate dehydratase HisB [Leptospiraceae bacterium]
MKARIAEAARKTSETEIQMKINLDGTGVQKFDMEIPFFEHMLTHISKHGCIDFDLKLRGDIGIDCHHSVEDTAIVLGGLIHQALGDKRGIKRYGHSIVTMDEVLTTVAIDLGGRYHFQYTGPETIKEGKFGIYDAELSNEFLSKLAMNARMNLHVIVHYGENRHHIHESVFKALGRALRMAAELDDRATGIPSTKGMLE